MTPEPARTAVEIDGVTLSYRDSGGPGPALVLLHGGTGNAASYWGFQIRELSRRFRVVAIDHRGFASAGEDVTESIRIEDLAGDVRRVIDHLGIAAVHLAGLSLGGCVAQQFALDHPTRLRKLVLSNTLSGYRTYALQSFSRDLLLGVGNLGPEGRALAQKLNLLFAYSFDYLDAHGEEMNRQLDEDAAAWDSIAASAQTRIIEALMRWSVVDRLHEISAPTLIVWGSHDIETPLSYARILQERLPTSCMHVIEGAGHKTCAERPEEWGSAVEAFLADR